MMQPHDADTAVDLEDFNENEPDQKEMAKDAKHQEIYRVFNLPHQEKVVKRYHCALQLTVQHNGWMYITTNCILFYSKFPTKETAYIVIDHINTVEKKKTAKVIPNAIKISTKKGKEYMFTAFISRDDAFDMIERQRVVVVEMKKKALELKEKQSVQANDAVVKHYHIFSKIEATEIVDSLSEFQEKDTKKGCCTII